MDRRDSQCMGRRYSKETSEKQEIGQGLEGCALSGIPRFTGSAKRGLSARNMNFELRESPVAGNHAGADGGGVCGISLEEDWAYVATAKMLLHGEPWQEPSGRIRIVSCDILENTSVLPGGGIALMNPTWPEPGTLYFWIQGCTLKQNQSEEPSSCVFVSHGLPAINELNVITGCSLKNNAGIGILVEDSYLPAESPLIEISRNGIESNLGGILIEDSEVSVWGNKILQNAPYGLRMKQARCVVSGNWFMRNTPNEIEAETSTSVSITGNAVLGEAVSERGIMVDGTTTCIANANNIMGHTIIGAEKLDGEVTWMYAMWSFWGDVSGPFHPLWWPTGLGDKVCGNVFFFPFSPDWVPMW